MRQNHLQVLFGFALIACAVSATAQNPTTPAPAVSATPPVRFSSEVKKAIAIIYTDCKDGTGPYKGTGFFVIQNDARLGNRSFGYLVTNKHVALPHVEDGHPCEVTRQRIRLNLKTPDPKTGASNFFVNVTTAWVFPTDDASIDLAAIPYAPNESVFDVKAIPMDMLATSDMLMKQGIGEGDSVFYVGYFYQLSGNLHTEPIVRQGIIAMIPDEPIKTTLGSLGKGFLADAHVFGGNSGSPMFVSLGGVRNGALYAGGGYLLLGVVSGLEREDADAEDLQPVVTYDDKVSANSGVSFVVPAEQIVDLIKGPALTAFRDEAIKHIPPQPPATPPAK
jgi:hypothetical protein